MTGTGAALWSTFCGIAGGAGLWAIGVWDNGGAIGGAIGVWAIGFWAIGV